MPNRADRMRHYFTRLREEFTRNGPIGLSKAVALNLKRKVLITNKATWYQLSLDEFFLRGERKLQSNSTL